MGEDNPRFRSRQCMFVLYPESQQEQIDFVQANYPCAWALHDRDIYSTEDFMKFVKRHEGEMPDWKPGDLKKPHIHFVCKFPNARYFSGIAKELHVPTPTIRRVNNLYRAYIYLWHQDDPDKFQYSKTIVGTHEFEEPSEHAGMSAAEDEQVQILLSAPHFDSYAEMVRWAYDNGCWATFKRNYAMWRDIYIETNRRVPSKKPDRFFGNMSPLSPDVCDPWEE